MVVRARLVLELAVRLQWQREIEQRPRGPLARSVHTIASVGQQHTPCWSCLVQNATYRAQACEVALYEGARRTPRALSARCSQRAAG